MVWVCGQCGKTLSRQGQPHGCSRHTEEALFTGKPPQLYPLYLLIKNYLITLGPLHINPARSAITFVADSTFAAIKIKRDALCMEFFLDRAEDIFPVEKVVRVSARRVVHFITLQTPDEFDETLKNWLKDAYTLCKK